MTWAEMNGLIDESQGAYRKGRSTIDHIFYFALNHPKAPLLVWGQILCCFH